MLKYYKRKNYDKKFKKRRLVYMHYMQRNFVVITNILCESY